MQQKLVIDDIGYVLEDETSVLFELVIHRYERKSLLVTSNQKFAMLENVFSNIAMAVAAVDRLVDDSTIVQFSGESYRRKRARRSAPPQAG
ncbi:ATP-binding protein [Cyanobium sp. AMD-g]|uniref:ATP-binding protein n=1 Tax=Cyanobium sp. AMD-g TaxID=2823699 RepID=UPI0020CE3BAD|nr:ATP-binding protein [Cyanobium sp. AMD-g]